MAARSKDPQKGARVRSAHAKMMKAAGKRYRKWKQESGQTDLTWARAMRRFNQFLR